MGFTLMVDFDSTLTQGTGSPWWVDPLDEEPRWEVIELVNELYKQNHTVIIYTAREERVRTETQYYLDEWGVKHHALKMNKPGYDLMIDDRCVSDHTALEIGVDGITSKVYDE